MGELEAHANLEDWKCTYGMVSINMACNTISLSYLPSLHSSAMCYMHANMITNTILICCCFFGIVFTMFSILV